MIILICSLLLFPLDQAMETLRNRIENAIAYGDMQCGETMLHNGDLLRSLYEKNQFQALWTKSQYQILLEALRGADLHGLEPGDYHIQQLEIFQRKSEQLTEPNHRLAADMELLASDAYLLYAHHLQNGRVHADGLDPNWFIDRHEGDLIPHLLDAVGRNRVKQSLADLAPQHAHYQRLQKALALWRTREEEAEWLPLEPGPLLKPGMQHPQINMIRQRFKPEAPASDRYDPALVEVVKDYQRRHFLEPDGMIGDQTREILNRTPQKKIGKIRANLERRRWLPREFAPNHIIVNIAGFDLNIYDQGEHSMHMEVIVGKPYRQTPVFFATMRYLVLSPFWQVPPSLAVRDKLPELRKDPAKLIENGFRAFKGWGDNTEEVDILSVDWHKVGKSFPYRLRQDPGPKNALGGVKFMFPNPHNVYLHDTPQKELFAKVARHFSSGCIRVGKPLDLAMHLLRDQSGYTREKVEALMQQKTETSINLKTPYQVLILYWTVEVNGEEVYFLPDIYGRDTPLIEHLDQNPVHSEVKR